MDWVVTIPKTIKWSDWKDEVVRAYNTKQILNYRLPGPSKCQPGERCYVVHDGYVRGYLHIWNVALRESFTCTTTGKRWPDGYYLQRVPEWKSIEPIPMKGFQGIRRFNEIR